MAQLGEKAIGDGRRFLQALDGAGIVSSAALWLWRPAEGAWRYVLASPLVAAKGGDMPVKIAAVLATMEQGFAIDRDTLLLFPPDDPAIQTLHRAVQTGPGIAALRMTGNVVNGVRIDDAYVYRLNRRAR
ncbi:MAG: hypothetical protein AB7R90_01560 [Reyranellaceae bacterium]